jgi:proteic killer suppression protein
MQIEFEPPKLKEIAESSKNLKKKYGDKQALEIQKRLNELKAAPHLKDIQKLPQAGLHPLKNNLKGYFAVYLKHPYRLLFRPNGPYDRSKLETIQEIIVTSLYHDYH